MLDASNDREGRPSDSLPQTYTYNRRCHTIDRNELIEIMGVARRTFGKKIAS
ncbi:MAG: hypothetical protein GY801_46730 [bacterium]|nr:hypothetical protein [bacterium]